MLQETHAADIEALCSRYADTRSAVLPLLYIAQDTYGTLTTEVIREVAGILNISYTDVFEVVGFYTLFYDQPFGKWMVQVCDDVPCCYLGAEELLAALKEQLQVQENETSADGMFTVQRVKCLAACHRAPVVQANLSYIYDVTADMADALIQHLRTHADSQEATSVSGHHAEDYEPTPDGTFRLIERRLGAIPAPQPATSNGSARQQAQESTPPASSEPAAQAEGATQAASDSPVAPSPDQAPAGAHPSPEKAKKGDDMQVPIHPAQQDTKKEASVELPKHVQQESSRSTAAKKRSRSRRKSKPAEDQGTDE